MEVHTHGQGTHWYTMLICVYTELPLHFWNQMLQVTYLPWWYVFCLRMVPTLKAFAATPNTNI